MGKCWGVGKVRGRCGEKCGGVEGGVRKCWGKCGEMC